MLQLYTAQHQYTRVRVSCPCNRLTVGDDCLMLILSFAVGFRSIALIHVNDVNRWWLLSTHKLLPADTSSTDKAPNAVLSKMFWRIPSPLYIAQPRPVMSLALMWIWKPPCLAHPPRWTPIKLPPRRAPYRRSGGALLRVTWQKQK